MKNLKALFCGLCLLLAPALQAQDWTLKSPATQPSVRGGHAMASIGGDQVLLFGGQNAGFGLSNETWVYDLSDNTWTLKSPATQPSARSGHAMASIGGDQVLLFGGIDAGGKDDETWVYDLSDNTWTLKSQATRPLARNRHAMASLGGDQVLLFGGEAAEITPADDETWIYDLSDNTWTLKNPITKPGVLANHAMVSLGGGQVLLFGGGVLSTFYDDTWVYDLSDNAWTLKNPAMNPLARIAHAMASLNGDQLLLFGGLDAGFSLSNETWVYDLSDNTWTLQSPTTQPSARSRSAMASLGGGQVLLFGGNDGSSDDKTWVYTAMPPVKPFIFLANKITLKRTQQSTPGGDMHSNGALTIEKGDPSIYHSNLTAVGEITIQKDNTINGDVTSATSISNSGTINGTPSVEPVATEPLPSLSYSAGGQNKTVPQNGTLSLAPGSYNNVTLNSFGTLQLASGDYYFTSLQYNSSTTTTAVIEIDLSSGAPITLNVVSNLYLGKEIEIRLLPNGEGDSELVTFNTLQSSAVSFGKEAYLLGSFNAPNAEVTLAKNSQLRGAMCVKELLVERDCLFLHHDSPGSLPGPGNLPKPSLEEEEVSSDQSTVISYQLEQNYPNPFNPSTVISFQLPVNSDVTLSVFNTNGQLVKQVARGNFASGRHTLVWDATDAHGERVASGVYLCRLRAGAFVAQRKLVLMR